MLNEMRAKMVTALEDIRDRFGGDAFDVHVWDLWLEMLEDRPDLQQQLQGLQATVLGILYSRPQER